MERKVQNILVLQRIWHVSKKKGVEFDPLYQFYALTRRNAYTIRLSAILLVCYSDLRSSMSSRSAGSQRTKESFWELPPVFPLAVATLGRKDAAIFVSNDGCNDFNRLLRVHLSQNLLSVILGVHLVDDAFEDAVLINDECLAERTH